MRKLSNTEAELKKALLIKKSVYTYHILSVGNVQVSHVYVSHNLCDIYKTSLRVMLKTYSDDRLIRFWSHPMVPNPGTLDWESSIVLLKPDFNCCNSFTLS